MKKPKTNFPNVAKLIRTSREAQNLKQGELAKTLGYSSAQFISNTERALCSLPPESWKVVARCLKIKPEEILEAQLQDEKQSLLEKSGIKLPNKQN